MAELAALLDPVNRLAEAAPGFVWRHQPTGAAEVRESGDASLLIVNLSVWRDVESLKAYVYSGEHLAVMRRRGEWLRRAVGGSAVLWWTPKGVRPTVDDGLRRLAMLHARGPGPDAFSFRTPIAPP